MAYALFSASTDPEAFGRVMAEAGAVGVLLLQATMGEPVRLSCLAKQGGSSLQEILISPAECLDKLLLCPLQLIKR